MKESKRIKALRQQIDQNKKYNLSDAVQLVKKSANARFDETIDISFYLGVDAKHSDQMVRGSVVLPHGSGKKVIVLVFAQGVAAEQAKAVGADYVGYQDLIEKIQKGWLDFQVAIATPDLMREIGKLGKILGARGLMPSPKTGTVTDDVSKAVKQAKAGKVDFRMDKTANLHVSCGKASFTENQLLDNVRSVINAVVKAKPAAAKGIYISSITVSSTMGPGVPVDLKEATVGSSHE